MTDPKSLVSLSSPSSVKDKSKSKKDGKKRSREVEESSHDGAGNCTVDAPPKKKKKKSKHPANEATVHDNSMTGPALPQHEVSLTGAQTEAALRKKKKKTKRHAKEETSLVFERNAQPDATRGSADATSSSKHSSKKKGTHRHSQVEVVPSNDNANVGTQSQMVQIDPLLLLPPSGTDTLSPDLFTGSGDEELLARLAGHSDDDLMKIMQNIDLSKVSLSSFGGDSFASSVRQDTRPPRQPRAPQTLQETRSTNAGTSAVVQRSQKAKRALNIPSAASGNEELGDHAYILANKWMSTGRLRLLEQTQGLIYKRGKFSAIEEQQLDEAIKKYCARRNLSEDQIQGIVFRKDGSKDPSFWTEITACVPQRPLIAVYHHVRRDRHPMRHQGNWTEDEDAALKQAVTDLGQQWEKISERVGRTSQDCRDRFRNHILDKEKRVIGKWSKDEEEKLTEIVTNMTTKQGKDPDNDIFWSKVSEVMGGKRSRQQCRIKWTDALSKTVKNEGSKPRWTSQDAHILVHKIDALKVRHDTEIDWKTVPDPGWNLWSAHTLQRRWLTMKRSIKGFEEMSHQEMVDILKDKKGPSEVSTSPSKSKKKKERRITSAETVTEEQDDMSD